MSRTGIFLLFLLFASTSCLFAQLDTVHWLPPMHARDGEGPQYLYLSTPETEDFMVTVSDGSEEVIASPVISHSKPFRKRRCTPP